MYSVRAEQCMSFHVEAGTLRQLGFESCSAVQEHSRALTVEISWPRDNGTVGDLLAWWLCGSLGMVMDARL